MKKYKTLDKFEVKKSNGGTAYFDEGFIIEHDTLNNLFLVHLMERDVLKELDKLLLDKNFDIEELIKNYKIELIKSE